MNYNKKEFPDSGCLFTNQFKQNEKHPSFKGDGEYKGVKFEISGWEKTDKNGNIFYSLKFSEPFNKEVHEQSNTKPTVTITETEDPLPF